MGKRQPCLFVFDVPITWLAAIRVTQDSALYCLLVRVPQVRRHDGRACNILIIPDIICVRCSLLCRASRRWQPSRENVPGSILSMWFSQSTLTVSLTSYLKTARIYSTVYFLVKHLPVNWSGITFAHNRFSWEFYVMDYQKLCLLKLACFILHCENNKLQIPSPHETCL
jgi:hypothetical protein